MNRPAELISQLRILGRLGGLRLGRSVRRALPGPDAHLRLHWHLRARCFARRLKADVLPQLPAKTRAVVPVELDNEAEYRLAERDLVAWLRSQPLDLGELDAQGRRRAARRAARAAERAQAARRARQARTRRCAGSTTSAPPASGSSCSPTTARSSARCSSASRSALHILGEDSHAARDGALRAFQAADDGAENQLIVCSIEVAGQGLTLTRSSNVAFLELDWTPAKHDQAEDRCHRIGQQDAVNAYYLLAAETSTRRSRRCSSASAP